MPDIRTHLVDDLHSVAQWSPTAAVHHGSSYDDPQPWWLQAGPSGDEAHHGQK